MWRKHRSVYQDHMNYIRSDIVKHFKVKVLHYAERVSEIYDLARYLPPPLIKGESADVANWTACNQEFTASEV